MAAIADTGSLHRRLARRGYEIFRTREYYPGERLPHRHEHYEVNMIWSGTMHYKVEGRTYHLTNGDILLLSPGQEHRPDPEGEQGSCERVVIWLEGDFLQQFSAPGFDAADCFGGTGGSACLRFDNEATMRIGELMDRCIRENTSEDFGSAMMADTFAIQTMILINRLHRRMAQSERWGQSGTLVGRVLEYINNHFSEELTLDGLAARFFISKYHLSREFGRIVGIPVHRYIIQKRLVVAKQLLSEGRSSSAVYQHCGFGDYSNFYRAFRNEYGISPKDYVATLRHDTASAREPEP